MTLGFSSVFWFAMEKVQLFGLLRELLFGEVAFSESMGCSDGEWKLCYVGSMVVGCFRGVFVAGDGVVDVAREQLKMLVPLLLSESLGCGGPEWQGRVRQWCLLSAAAFLGGSSEEMNRLLSEVRGLALGG